MSSTPAFRWFFAALVAVPLIAGQPEAVVLAAIMWGLLELLP